MDSSQSGPGYRQDLLGPLTPALAWYAELQRLSIAWTGASAMLQQSCPFCLHSVVTVIVSL
jgi:hypothetical protein